MSNSTQDSVIGSQKNDLETTVSRENNSNNTESTAEHQEGHLESCPILTTQTNHETVSLSVQSPAGEDNVSEHNTSSSKQGEAGICAAAKDVATLLAFILYMSDIVSDVFVSGYYFSQGKIGYGFLILFFVYFTSFFTALDSKWNSYTDYKFWMIFIFNLSGVLVYGDIIYLLCRKWSKKDYNKDSLNMKQQVLHDTLFAEGFFEAYPQILIQTCILSESITANEQVSWLRYTSIVISTLGATFSIIRFGLFSDGITMNNITFNQVTMFLLDLFEIGLVCLILLTTAAAAVSSGIVYFFIIPFLVLMLILSFESNISQFISKLSFLPKLDSEVEDIIPISIGIILTTICWYFTRNAVLWYWPLTFEFINYFSIAYFVIGLVVTILIIIYLYNSK